MKYKSTKNLFGKTIETEISYEKNNVGSEHIEMLKRLQKDGFKYPELVNVIKQIKNEAES